MMTDPGLPLTTGEGNTAEVCADCGIPLVWCRRVTSNPAHCWRWDYERFDDMATECGRLREQLAESEAANESYAVEATMAREQLDAATAENERLRLLVIAALERAEKAEGTGAPKDAR